LRIKLFKSIQRTTDKYLLNRLEIQESVLIDEVGNLNLSKLDHPESERLDDLWQIKRDELDTVQHNIKVIKERLQK
jgi:hypothetical protein